MVEARPEAKDTTATKSSPATDEEKKQKVNSLQEALVRSQGKDAEKAAKLYQVVKALSAMRLCKEDSVPDAVLCRVAASAIADGDPQYVPALPKTQGAVSEIANNVAPEARGGDPCLFQGSIGTAYNKKALTDNGITHILTAASNIGSRFKTDFTYKVLNLLDSPNQNIVQFFDAASDWIEQVLAESPNNRVLVHCFAGKSRASTMTCAYLMKKQGLTLREALLHLRACRPIAFPNIGFLVQLKAYETTVHGSVSDVPLKLEKLFGIEPTSQGSAAAATNTEGMTEEQKSEAKALADAEEQLAALQNQQQNAQKADSAPATQENQ